MAGGERVKGKRTEKMEENTRKRIDFLPRNESVFTLKGSQCSEKSSGWFMEYNIGLRKT